MSYYKKKKFCWKRLMINIIKKVEKKELKSIITQTKKKLRKKKD